MGPEASRQRRLRRHAVEKLRRVAALVSVVSPRYVGPNGDSRNCRVLPRGRGARRRACAGQGADLQGAQDLSAGAASAELRPARLRVLQSRSDDRQVRELDEIFGAEAERDFWLKLDDLAHDVCGLLEMVRPLPTTRAVRRRRLPGGDDHRLARRARGPSPRSAAARTHGPSRSSAPRRGIRSRGRRARVSRSMPALDPPDRQNLQPRARGSEVSLIDLQNELAIERAGVGQFSRLLWIPPAIDRSTTTAAEGGRAPASIRATRGADLLETPLEALRTLVHPPQPTTPAPNDRAAARKEPPSVYLIYDSRDADVIAPWVDFLFKDFEVIQPLFDGDEAEMRELPRGEPANLRRRGRSSTAPRTSAGCGGKLREVQKSVGYGRTKPMPTVGICLIAPRTPEKNEFRTHEAIVIPQWDGCLPILAAFLSRLEPGGRNARVTANRKRCLTRFRACGPSSPTKTISFSVAKEKPTSCCAGCVHSDSCRWSARLGAASHRWSVPG